jgi:predicted nucleic acid-binding protein
MGIKYLWDTNTVIYFLQKQFPRKAEQFVDSILEESPPAISSITEIELLCWKTTDKKSLEILHKFVEDIIVFELDKPVKLKAVDIRKSSNLKLPDAIIAATALIHQLTLVTRNTKDFKNITGLQTANPFEL